MVRSKLYGTRYPWDDWFARSERADVELVRGRDFHADCLPASFGVMLRTRMAARGLFRTILVRGDVVTVGPKHPEFWRGPPRKARPRRAPTRQAS